MEFLLNQNQIPIKVDNFNPNITILQWLRDNSLSGTKEGCAAGDCGACVAVIGELSSIKGERQLTYKSVNTCITLLAAIAGKHLITVEGLAGNKELHPVQEAMVVTHGSQCGFCTPGFVMSLFALYHNENEVNLAKINNALSGNLCRCTGYEPIIDAALLAFKNKNKHKDYYQLHNNDIVTTLKQISTKNNTNYQNIRYQTPQTIDELQDILAADNNAKILAGSSDIGLEITQRLTAFSNIVFIKNIQELQLIKDDKETITIGSAVSYEQMLPILSRYFPTIKQFINRFASKPVRNWATLGGNIANASPIGDMPPVLIALGARITLSSKQGDREILLEDFFIDYKQTVLKKGEFIRSIVIPKLKTNEKLILYKLSKRFEDDISIVCLAFKAVLINAKLVNITIVFGAMAAVPKRAQLTADAITDAIVNNQNSNNLLDVIYRSLTTEFQPLTDVRGSSKYRIMVAAKLVEKAILQAKNENVIDLSCEQNIEELL